MCVRACAFPLCRFQVKKKQFFRNFGAIMTYGIVGVFISFGVISAGEGAAGLAGRMRVEDCSEGRRREWEDGGEREKGGTGRGLVETDSLAWEEGD